MNRLAAALIAAFRGRQGPRPPGVVSIDDLLHDTETRDLDEHFDQAREVVEAGRIPAARPAADADTEVLTVAPAPPAETGVDVELLRRTLEHITAHPDQWRQRTWWDDDAPYSSCGTAGCLAGWAVHLGRPTLLIDSEGDVFLDGRYQPVPNVAQEDLRLTVEQAELLFKAGNTLRDLWTLAARYSGGAIAVPAELPDGS